MNDIDRNYISHLEIRIECLEKLNSELNHNINVITDSYNDLSDEMSELKKCLKDTEGQVETIQKEYDVLEIDKKELEKIMRRCLIIFLIFYAT